MLKEKEVFTIEERILISIERNSFMRLIPIIYFMITYAITNSLWMIIHAIILFVFIEWMKSNDIKRLKNDLLSDGTIKKINNILIERKGGKKIR